MGKNMAKFFKIGHEMANVATLRLHFCCTAWKMMLMARKKMMS